MKLPKGRSWLLDASFLFYGGSGGTAFLCHYSKPCSKLSGEAVHEVALEQAGPLDLHVARRKFP